MFSMEYTRIERKKQAGNFFVKKSGIEFYAAFAWSILCAWTVYATAYTLTFLRVLSRRSNFTTP
jgi:hypothetical protein